jgi:hypothetical protein
MVQAKSGEVNDHKNGREMGKYLR